jgi:hypothetical protein
VVSLSHGDFVGAGSSFGKGALGLGEHVGVGTVKGGVKIGRGLGGEFRKIGHHSRESAS